MNAVDEAGTQAIYWHRELPPLDGALTEAQVLGELPVRRALDAAEPMRDLDLLRPE